MRSLLPGATAPPKPFRPDLDMPVYALPDPLRTAGGRSITTADEWRTLRRPELLELFREHVYGRVPDTPYEKRFRIVHQDREAMEGAATLKQVDVTIARGTASLTIHVVLFVPNRAPKPVPAFLLIDNRGPEQIDPARGRKSEFWPAEEAVARGCAMAAFHNGDVDPDRHDGFQDGIHGLLDPAVRSPDAWGTIAAWAWGASRVMDYLETDADLARDQIALIGHSRGGKTALWAGAQDERFALVVSNNSGCTGAAISRRRFEGKESVARINHLKKAKRSLRRRSMSILNTETLHARLSELKARHPQPPWSEPLAVTENVIGTLICQAPGHPNDRHYHLRDEWWIVLEGEIDWELEGRSEPIHARAGDFVFAPAHVFHHIHVCGDQPAIRLAISYPGEWHRRDRP